MPETLAYTIGSNVRAEMRRKGVFQRQLAAHLGLAQSQVWHRLNGTIEFRPSELEKAADLLGVPMSTFLPTPAASAA